MKKEENKNPREDMVSAWTSLVIMAVIMFVLSTAIFGSWQFWMWFAIMAPVLAIIATTSEYFNSAKKCSNCGRVNAHNSIYCNKCGSEFIAKGHSYNANAGVKNANPNTHGKINPQYSMKATETSANQGVNERSSLKFCAVCGQKIDRSAKFCASCGYSA